MFRSLLPRETNFFDFFEEHVSHTIEGCRELLAMCKSGEIAAGYARIRESEHRADAVAHKCIQALHNTFITPIDRPDIQRLINMLDDVIDSVDKTASRLAIYEISEMRPEALSLAEILLRTTELLQDAVKKMRNMKNAEAIHEVCVAIHKLESDAGAIHRTALARLFKEEEQRPILVIKWYEIFQLLETAIDRCEDAADIVEGVVIEAS